MIPKLALSILILIGCSLVQATWLGPIAILGVRPDLGLVALLWMSYRNGPVQGSSAGFVSGLIDDSISASPLGLNAFIKTLIAWIASFLHGSISLDHLLLPAILGSAATLAKAAISLVLTLLFKDLTEAYDPFGRVLWIETAYNAVVAPILFLLLDFVFGSIGAKDRKARV